MSPVYSPTTNSAGMSQVGGPGTSLDFTPVQEPEPAVDSDAGKISDMSIFIALVAINSAQIAA